MYNVKPHREISPQYWVTMDTNKWTGQ